MAAPRFFAHLGPSRRADQRVVEVQLDVDPGMTAVDRAAVGAALTDAGISGIDVSAGSPDGTEAGYLALLAQVALALQQAAGHPVEGMAVFEEPIANRWVALVDYEHPDVGLTAVKLAAALLDRQLADPEPTLATFREFAGQRALSAETRALVYAAIARGIPWQLPQQLPCKAFMDLEKDAHPKATLLLGQGCHLLHVDGVHCTAHDSDRTRALGAVLTGLAGQGAPAKELEQAAGDLLAAWMPPPETGRIPVIAVTGTNGKTTTTRLLRHVLASAGRQVAMTCTDGLFVGETHVAGGDQGAIAGHARALTYPGVEAAVLETHHGNLLVYGFAYARCDVGICLNVSEDHIGVEGVVSVPHMATIKRSVPERADGMAVLFADDPLCVDMLPFLDARRIGLVSLSKSATELAEWATSRGLPMHRLVTATLDEAGPLPALVFCEGTDGLLRLPVNALPMAYGGAAQFNLSNAAHAALALIGLGLSTEDIEAGLRSFEPGPDMTPGRMNLFTQLPFTVLMDFAHNPDGMRQVAAFVDAYPVSGRRLVAFAGSPGRPERTHRELSRALAGHFDHYFCKEYKMPPGKAGIVAAPALRDELLKQGVAPEQVTVTHHGPEVIARIFDACRPGDLLVMLMGHVEQHELPGYIEDHARRLAG